MSRICVTVDVDGAPIRAQFTKQPTLEEIDAFKDLIRTVKRNLGTEHPFRAVCECGWGMTEYTLVRAEEAASRHGLYKEGHKAHVEMHPTSP